MDDKAYQLAKDAMKAEDYKAAERAFRIVMDSVGEHHQQYDRRQHRQRFGGVPLGQEYPSPADGEIVGLSQMSGCRQITLAKQRQHLGSSNFRHPKHKVMLAYALLGLC